jgi:hypothetical protein
MAARVQFSAESTPFFQQRQNQLFQVVRATIDATDRLSRAEIFVSGSHPDTISLGRLSAGKHAIDVFIPSASASELYRLVLKWDGGQLAQTVKVNPERRWTIYVVQHSHLDVGYTDPAWDVMRYHRAYLDQVLEWCEATQQWDQPFKWTVETILPLAQWLDSRSKPRAEKMASFIHKGQIEVCGAWVNMHTEAYDLDEMAQTFQAAGYLKTRWHVPIETVMQTDVPGQSDGFLKCVQALGAKYLSVARNHAGRAQPERTGLAPSTRWFYWTSQNAKQRPLLVWYTDSPHGLYMEGNQIGLTDSVATVEHRLPTLLRQLEREGFLGSTLMLRVQGAFWDNAAPNIVPLQVVREWNQRWAYPKLVLATPREFFEAIERAARSDVPTFYGEWADWWADGIGSAARENGLNRMAHNTLKTAEYFHTLAFLEGHEPYPSQTAAQALDNMALFDEHTWGAAYPWDNTMQGNTSGELQWWWKANLALNAYSLSKNLMESGLSLVTDTLGATSDRGGNGLGTILCYNPTAVSRTDTVEAWIPHTDTVDASNQPNHEDQHLTIVDVLAQEPVAAVPIDPPSAGIQIRIDSETGALHEIRAPRPDQMPRPRGTLVMFTARDVPAFGYKAFEVRMGPQRETDQGLSASDGSVSVLDNPFYRVEVDGQSGVVTQIYDKELACNLVNLESGFGFGEYIYERYATAPKFNHLSGRIGGKDLPFLGSREGIQLSQIRRVVKTALFDAITLYMMAPGCHGVEMEIRLFHTVKKIEWRYTLNKIATMEKEAVFIGFPFSPKFREIFYQTNGGYASGSAPQVPGGCDYLKAVQHWIALTNKSQTLLLSTIQAPLIEIGAMRLPYAPFEPSTLNEPSTIFSFALNNIWDTNFPVQQGGEIPLTYALTSYHGPFEAHKALAFADQLVNPLAACWTPAKITDPLGQFLEMEQPPNVQLLSMRKMSGDESAVLLRWLEYEGIDGEVALSFRHHTIVQAWETDITGLVKTREIPISDRGIRVAVASHSIVTIEVYVER